MFRDIAGAHPPATQLVLATLIGSPGRDWWLTMLTDAQVAAQAFDFRAETHLGHRGGGLLRSLAPSKSKTAERAMHSPKLWR